MLSDFKPKISIIGGSGFVGTNLCTLLNSLGTPFEIIDIKKSKQFPEMFKYGDVRDLDSLNDAVSGRVVVYLAAIHRDDIRDKNKYQETNVYGAKMSSGFANKRELIKLSLQVLLPFGLPKKVQTNSQLDHLMIMAERRQKQRMSCEGGNKKGHWY